MQEVHHSILENKTLVQTVTHSILVVEHAVQAVRQLGKEP